MQQSTKLLSVLVAAILPLVALGFGLQSGAGNVVGGSRNYLSSSRTAAGPSLFPQRHISQQQHHRNFLHSMKPFWKSSSSPDNESEEEAEDSSSNAGGEPLLPSEDAVVEEEIVVFSETESTTENTESTPSTQQRQEGLLDLLNDIGQQFKPKAETAIAKGYQAEGQGLSLFYAIKACLYYSLFILYRAYRGLFILVPAVFRKVYQKMELAMNSGDLTLAEDDDDAVSDTATAADPPKMTWRTKITVSILASVVTASYVVGATFQMASKFVKTVLKSKSLPTSFEAAADELVTYEDKVSKIGKINGDPDPEPSGFAP